MAPSPRKRPDQEPDRPDRTWLWRLAADAARTLMAAARLALWWWRHTRE